MAIDRIPGVGPQNSDIAAAVNAPSAATIASTVASSVPNLTQITNAIINNASPAATTVAAITSAGNSAGWGNTGDTNWVAIASGTVSGSLSLSSLSGYKKYRLVANVAAVGDTPLRLRWNGITSAYWHGGQAFSTNSSNATSSLNSDGVYGTAVNIQWVVDICFEQANLTGYKMVEAFMIGQSNGGFPGGSRIIGTNRSSTESITSIQLAGTSASFNNGIYTLYGGN